MGKVYSSSRMNFKLDPNKVGEIYEALHRFVLVNSDNANLRGQHNTVIVKTYVVEGANRSMEVDLAKLVLNMPYTFIDTQRGGKKAGQTLDYQIRAHTELLINPQELYDIGQRFSEL